MDVLANWLWQGTAVALAATAILRGSPRISATTRYHLWWVTLIVVLALPAFSLQLPAASSQREAFSAQSGDFALEILAGSWKPETGSWTRVVLPTLPAWVGSLLVLVWSAWASISLARTLAALVTLRHAKRTSRPFPELWEVRLHTWLSLRARGRHARLAVSDEVRAAAVLGLTSPSIAVAPGALGVLTDAELDQIVVHEWAHVQRRDDIARLVQRIIMAIAGLHPAIWWIDRQLHLERETACDDWAVNATGSARGLALCLTKLAALPGRPTGAVLLPAALLSSELTTRVVRLLDRRRNTSTAPTLGVPMLVALVLGALALTVASVELVVTSPMALDALPEPVSAVSATTESRSAGWSAPSSRELPAAARVSSRPLPVQDSARIPVRTRAQAIAPAGSSQDPATIPSRTTPTNQEGEQRTVPVPRLVHEDQLADLPGTTTPVSAEIVPAPGGSVPAASQAAGSPTPWRAAADAGVTVGKGSQKAAVATAGFFTRLSRSITGVF